MKTFLIVIALFVFWNTNAIAQCDNIDGSEWVADIELLGDYTTDVDYTGMKVFIDRETRFYKNVKFTDCDIRVEFHIQFADGATFEIDNCVLSACEPDIGCGGFRANVTTGAFQDPVYTEVSIKNSEFYGFIELFHMNLKSGSKFEFVDNYAECTFAFAHMFHFVNYGNKDDFKFYGNTLKYATTCITVQSDLVWEVGDNTQNPNVFEGGFGNPLSFSNNSSVVFKGGSVNFKNTVFSGNHSGVYTQYGRVDFDNCTFQDSEFGLTANSGIYTMSNCNFLNNEIGIHTSANNMNIDRSFFKNNDIGVKVSLANQSNGGLIVTNSNFNNNIDMHTTGAFFNEIQISKNVFEGQNYGIFADGESFCQLENNDFIGQYINSLHLDNGGDNNLLQENNYRGYIGLHVIGSNPDLKFFDNCFSTTEDINITGSVAAYMGIMNTSTGAGNCFTDNAIDINNAGTTFDYALPQSEYSTCHEPIYNSNYNLVLAATIAGKNCGSGNTTTVSDLPICGVSWSPSCLEVLNALANVNTEITEVISSSILDAYTKQVITSELNKCKRRLLILKMKECEPISVPQEIVAHTDFHMKAKGAGFLISNGDLTGASLYLDNINPIGEEALDYIAVQRINIRRLGDLDNFVLTATEETFLNVAGNKSYPLAAYARGLLTITTGDIIYPQIALGNRSVLLNNTKTTETLETEFVISPNPTSNDININWESDTSKKLIFEVYDLNGMLKTTLKNTTTTQIQMEDWTRGIYILRIMDEWGNTIYTDRIIKI